MSARKLLFLVLFGVLTAPTLAQLPRILPPTPHFADYDSEPRLANGHVDCETLLARLKELHVTAYYWLVWHAATDWDDLKAFLPKAAAADLQVWVYLVPPTESAPKYGTTYPEPFRLDYGRWAEEIARLSLQHTNLTGWVIDDFYGNHEFFTPAAVGEFQKRAKAINPRLVFLPLMYFGEIRRPFVEDYRKVIDGVVVAYPQGREDIEQARSILNDAATVIPGELSFPWYTPSQAGDFVQASVSATVLPDGPPRLHFSERDDFTAGTSGYHFKQLLVNDTVVWEADVAGGSNAWREVWLSLPASLQSGDHLTLSFRLFDKKGVSNFGVSWRVQGLRVVGLKLDAPLYEPKLWKVSQRGPFGAGFGDRLKQPTRSFHVPFIVMTAGQPSEFKLRHGEPASPERMAAWLKFCLEAWWDRKCDGVVTYCLDKQAGSKVFDLSSNLFRDYRPAK